MTRPVKPCGSPTAARDHYRRGEKACDVCREAARRARILQQLHGGGTVSALGVRRRIRALQAIGYSRARLANELGYASEGALSHMVNSATVFATTHQRVSELYDRLSMVIPTGVGPDRARGWAARNGYAPPLAWDDIDNPRERAKTRTRRRAPRLPDPAIVVLVVDYGQVPDYVAAVDRRAVVTEWIRRGRPLLQLEHLTGWNVDRTAASAKARAA